jgi:membrane-associated phospholipid phosphatase
VAFGLLALAVGVCWSRLVLRRHTLAEVVVGFVAGGVAGFGFHLCAA